MKKFTLVLGSGAAKGFVHLGVLRQLEREGILPDLIIGCSMGALIGGLYAKGMSADEIIAESIKIDNRKVMDYDIFAPFKMSFLGGKKVDKLLLQHFGEMSATETKIPFACITASLQDGKEHVLTEGLLRQNIRASISIPMLFPAVKIDNISMVDGGICNAVPSDVAKRMLPDSVVLAVDPIGSYSYEKHKLQLVGVAINTFNLLTTQNAIYHSNQADILLSEAQPDVKLLAFNKKTAEKLIKRGEKWTKDIVPKLKKLLGK